MEQITKNVYVENGFRGSNPGFVVTAEGIVMIDTPVELENAKKWSEEIGRRGKLRFLINTEHHFDHWLYNFYFDGPVIAHESAREVMSKMDVGYIRKRTKVQYQQPLPINDDHPLRLPGITYSEHMTLHLGRHTFQLLHMPGHTIGQTAVYIPEEKVIFTGDNVFGEKRTAIHDADLDKWLESLKRMEPLDFEFIAPGHGKVCQKAFLKTQIGIIQGLLENSKTTKGPEVSNEIRKKVDPFYPTRDIGLIP